MRFQSKVTLITGAGRGIGRATALRFAREGAHVVVVDRLEAEANAVAEEIRAMGRPSLALVADVADESQSRQMIERVIQALGRLDVVFANAGVSHHHLVTDMPVADWDEVIRVNLRGVFLTCKHAAPELAGAGGGAIVTMASSMAGWDTLAEGAAYMASKAGVRGLTKSLALQLAGHGIRVNAVCPGVIYTRLGSSAETTEAELAAKYERFARRIPLRRVGQPDDVAAAVTFLASDDARHITGTMLLIDGGQTLQSWSNAPDEDAYPLLEL